MRLFPDSAFTEYNHSHDSKTGEFTTTPETPENADHFMVSVQWTVAAKRPWAVVTKSGRTLKTFADKDMASKFVDSGKAHKAAKTWQPGHLH